MYKVLSTLTTMNAVEWNDRSQKVWHNELGRPERPSYIISVVKLYVRIGYSKNDY